MKKRRCFFILAVGVCLSSCGISENNNQTSKSTANTEFSVEQMNEKLIEAASKLSKSENLFYDKGLEITGMGVTYNGRPKEFDGCFYFPAIEALTGVHVNIDWQESEGYSSAVATTLLTNKENMPDIINPTDFGVMDLADDKMIVPLDDYLSLMPDLVKAVGEEQMDNWRADDGHIYTIPSVSTIQGSFSMMIRKDWLEELGLNTPETWEDWLTYWRGVRDHDMNGNGDTTDEIPLALPGGVGGERSLTLLLNAFGIKASNDTQFCLLEDGTYTLIYEHPRYADFLENMAGLYAEGILVDGYLDFTYDSIEEGMGNNTLGSAMAFAASGAQTSVLRDSGDEDALWSCVEPIPGPNNDQMIAQRTLVANMWCITAAALEKNKVEDIVRFFNWCYTKEGTYLYNYGIEGVSYSIEDGKPVLNKELVSSGFNDYWAVGINYEPFGGYWLKDAYMQCLFERKTEKDLSDIQQEIYKGLFVINNDFFYSQPITLETKSYVKYRSSLISEGVCRLRDQAIRGEITQEEFWNAYKELKKKGLSQIIDEASEQYRVLVTGGENG